MQAQHVRHQHGLEMCCRRRRAPLDRRHQCAQSPRRCSRAGSGPRRRPRGTGPRPACACSGSAPPCSPPTASRCRRSAPARPELAVWLSATRLQCGRSAKEAPKRRCKDVWGQAGVVPHSVRRGRATAHLPVPAPAAGSKMGHVQHPSTRQGHPGKRQRTVTRPNLTAEHRAAPALWPPRRAGDRSGCAAPRPGPCRRRRRRPASPRATGAGSAAAHCCQPGAPPRARQEVDLGHMLRHWDRCMSATTGAAATATLSHSEPGKSAASVLRCGAQAALTLCCLL